MLTPFAFEQPESLQEAQRLASICDCRFVNGGTDVLIQIRAAKASVPAIISLKNIEELKKIEYRDGVLFIGAGATLSAIQHSTLVSKYCPALTEGISKMASPQIRNTGTLGGNVGTASPAGDGVTALISENAFAEICGLGGTRVLPVSDLIVGPKRTSLKQGEIIRGFYVSPQDWTFAHFFKVGRRNSLAISIVNGVVKLKIGHGIIEKASITVGAVAQKPFHVAAAENLLEGRPFDKNTKESLRRCISEQVSPIDDIRASESYRRYIAGVQCARLVEQGWEAAKRG